jgi:hypothetical protein
MGMIVHTESGQTRMLAERTVVGRASSCDIHLTATEVSSDHAALRWAQGQWVLVDLCSRNGTWIDGNRLSSAGSASLLPNALICFGSPSEAWTLASDAPPRAFARSSAADIEIVDGLLALPSADEPLLTVGLASDGTWFVEDDEGRRATEDRDLHTIGGIRWRLYLPSQVPHTAVGTRTTSPMTEVQLVIRHDQTEEHLTAELHSQPGVPIDLGARAHHMLLLELARARLEDRGRGIDPAEEGWIHREELSERLKLDVNHVNIMIHRLRRQLADLGIADGASMIQRRARSGLLRLGPARVQVGRL